MTGAGSASEFVGRIDEVVTFEPLTQAILAGRLPAGSTVRADLGPDGEVALELPEPAELVGASSMPNVGTARCGLKVPTLTCATVSLVPRTVIAWLVVAPWAVWAVARVLGVERGYPFVQLMAYTPYVLPLALVAGAGAALLRRWAPAALAAGTVIVLAVLLVPRATGDAAEARAGGPELRVLTANTYRGSVPPQALLELVRRERVDLLALQELTPRLAAGLERAGIRELLPHGTVVPGSGLYSRLPLRPLAPFRGARSEMAAATVDVSGSAAVRIVSVHVAVPLDGGDLAGWRADLRALPAAPPRGPVQLLAGDFNATLDHDALRGLVGRGYRDAAEAAGAGLKPTWQGHRAPPVTIDHVLAPERTGVLGVTVHDLQGSDHRAVFAVLALPEA